MLHNNEIANKKYIRSIDGSRILHVNYPLCDYSELHSGRDPIAGFNSGFFKILFFVNSYTQQLKCLIVDKNKSYYLIIPALFSELHNIEIQPNGIILYLSHWDQILAYLITPDGKVVSISQYNLITSFVCNQKPIYYSTVGQ